MPHQNQKSLYVIGTGRYTTYIVTISMGKMGEAVVLVVHMM